MKLSLFTVVLQQRSLEDAIRKTAELGYDGIEIMCRAPHFTDDMPLSEVEKYKKLLDENHLPVVNLATYAGAFSTLSDTECSQQLDKLKHYLQAAEILDCPMLRIWSGGPSIYLAQDYHLQKSSYWFQQAADIAAMANKKIVMEIHNGALIETVEAARKFVDGINKPNVGLILDPGNMYITGTDFGEKSVEILFDKIFHVHVKEEMRVKDDKLPHTFHNKTKQGDEIFQYRLSGEGAVGHRPVFRKLKQLGYQGYLSVECHGMDNDYQTAQHEIEFLRLQINKLKK